MEKFYKPEENNSLLRVKECGNIITTTYNSNRTHIQTIQKIKGTRLYKNTVTGEIRVMEKHDNRSEQQKGLYKTFENLKNIINCNCTKPKNILWVTLTYAENMTDVKRLYTDFKNFWKRYIYFHEKENLPKPEYIIACEPQERGAWHVHGLFIYPSKAPYIPNEVMSDLWKQGFVRVNKLKDVDNIGVYLTAYLTDIETDIDSDKTKIVNDKKYIKGGRLHLYPSGMNLYRTSRNIKRPIIYDMSKENMKTILKNGYKKTYQKEYDIVNTNGKVQHIKKTTYKKIK